MAKFKYYIRGLEENGPIRTSAREYTHAVVVINAEGKYTGMFGCCGRLDLAEKLFEREKWHSEHLASEENSTMKIVEIYHK